MADAIRGKSLGETFASGVGTNAGVTITVPKVAKQSTVLTDVTVSGDAAALVTITWTVAGVSKTLKLRFSAAFATELAFHPGALIGDTNTDITVNISASTSNCEAFASGFYIPGTTGYAGYL